MLPLGMMASLVTAQHADTPITAPSVEMYTGQDCPRKPKRS